MMRVLSLYSFALLALAACLAGPAAAQQVQRIAAIVNDEVISGFDVAQRTDLIINSTQLQDTPETRRRLRGQVLRALVDEQLQLQEARRNNITVGEDEIARAFARLAQQNNMSVAAFERQLAQRGISKTTLERQIRADIAWNRLVARRVQPSVTIGNEQVEEVLERLKRNSDLSRAQISEIFLPVDSAAQEAEVQRTAERLVSEIRAGASFAAVARQFSRGTSAISGGEVGWVRPGQLDPELDQTIASMRPGEVSDPVRALGGFYILKLEDILQPGTGSAGGTVALQQVLVPGLEPGTAETAQHRADLQALSDAHRGCEGLPQAIAHLPAAEHHNLGTLRLSELPENLRQNVSRLEIGEFTAPIEQRGALMLLMLCDRDAPDQAIPDREEVAEELGRQRLAILAQRYLRDLRHRAAVELR